MIDNFIYRVAKSDLDSTDAYFAKKIAPKNGPKMTKKYPK